LEEAGGRAEAAGWRAVAAFRPVPQLLDIRLRVDDLELVYEDVFTTGRCRRLLADAINTADREPADAGSVEALVDQVCDQLLPLQPDVQMSELRPWPLGTRIRAAPGRTAPVGENERPAMSKRSGGKLTFHPISALPTVGGAIDGMRRAPRSRSACSSRPTSIRARWTTPRWPG
jgi:hypothetical protein